MRTCRGRTRFFQFPKDGAASLESEEDAKRETVGFRLTYAVPFEAYRGSLHSRTPDIEYGPDRCLVASVKRTRNLGFRLVFEEGK